MARSRKPKETHRDVPVKTYWSDAEYAELERPTREKLGLFPTDGGLMIRLSSSLLADLATLAVMDGTNLLDYVARTLDANVAERRDLLVRSRDSMEVAP